MLRDPILLDRARFLRRNMGDAEKKLWYQLRRRKMAGFRFRRQVPIGAYIVDFACLSARFIIEVDGGQHNEEDNAIVDAKRTAWLESRGYRVLRFWNSSVLSEIDSVTETIFNVLDEMQSRSSPPPHPPPPPPRPLRGRERTLVGPSPTPTLPLRGREKILRGREKSKGTKRPPGAL